MIAYLVLAHHQPDHLARLVRALQSPQARCFVHLDARADLRGFAAAEAAGAVFVVPRMRVYWGGWSQVAATLRLLNRAHDDPVAFTHFALISGSDYPLATTGALLGHLAASRAEHIDSVPFPNVEHVKPMSRLSKRHLQGGERRAGWRGRAIRFANRLLARLPDRDVATQLDGMATYTGAQWWVLSRRAVTHVLAFVARGGAPLRLFRLAHIPDEIFFQTVVASMPDVRIAHAFTYTDWSERRDGPATITHAHLDQLEQAGLVVNDDFGTGPCMFVRKVDGADPSIYGRLDAYRLGATHPHA